MITKSEIYIFLFIGITPCTSFTMTSRLELVPGAGLVEVKLPFSYCSPTEDEKKRTKRVDEGCCTLVEKGDCVLVGPCAPCEFIQLYDSKSSKALIGHLSFSANKKSFLGYAKNEFTGYDSAHITGTIFTAHYSGYENAYVQIGTSILSRKDLYQGRTQLEELKDTKDTIIAEFGIVNRNQIQAHKFNSGMKDWELGAYELAEIYIFAKYKNGAAPSLHSICPVTENMYGDFQHLPIQERLNACSNVMSSYNKINPYFRQFKFEDAFKYGAHSFVKI